jgi:hypothetical protein
VRWCHPAAVWSRRWSGLLGSVPVSVLLTCPGCGSTRWRLTGGACGRRPAVGRRYWPGVPGRRPCRPSPAPRPPVGCPPVRFPRPGSGRPTVRCPAVRCPAVRCPVSWFRRPGSNRPAGWCPSARSLLVGGSPAVAVGITSGAGNLAAGTDRVAGGLRVPSGLVDGPSRPGGGDAVVVGRWGSGGRGPGRVGLGRRLRPCSTAGRRGGQLGVRVAGRCRPLGVAGTFLGHDHAPWSLWSLMARWTGLEGPTRSTVRMVCGPSAAQPGVSEPGWGPTAL